MKNRNNMFGVIRLMYWFKAASEWIAEAVFFVCGDC